MSGEKLSWVNEVPEDEPDTNEVKDNATYSAEEMERRIRLERLKKRREDFNQAWNELPNKNSEEASELKMAFYEQQGDDLITEEALRQEWNTEVVAPGKEGHTFGEVPIEQALRAMESIVEGKSFSQVEDEMRANSGEPGLNLVTARLVARFSERGPAFAKVAGITDLNETDPKGYWRTVKNADGSLREPFEKKAETVAMNTVENSANSREFAEWFKWYKGYNDGELEAILNSLKANKGIYEYADVTGKHVLLPTMSVDDAYKEVLGCSKEEYAKKVFELNREIEAEKERLEREAEKKIPSWVERGKAFIYPEKVEDWTNMVKSRAKGIFYGEDIEDALAVMEKLDAGMPVEEIREFARGRNYLGNTFGSSNAIIFAFSKRGPEFITKMLDSLSLAEVMKISDKQRQNNRLAEFSHPDISQRSAS